MLLAVVERAPPANRTAAHMLGPRSVLALASPIVAPHVLPSVGGRSEITRSVEKRGQPGAEIPRNPGETGRLRPRRHQRVAAGSTLFSTNAPG
jgi:hypothetical protein